MRSLIVFLFFLLGVLASPAQAAEVYVISDVQVTKAREEVTYFHIPKERSGIVTNNLELPGEECLVCVARKAEFRARPKPLPDEYRKRIKGPQVNLLSVLYLTSGLPLPEGDFRQTTVAVGEGAVQVTPIVKVGEREMRMTSVMVRGNTKRKNASPLDLRTSDRKQVFLKKPEKPEADTVTVNPCGYVKLGRDQKGLNLTDVPSTFALP
ncbi:MAG: hypothetical protein HYT89_01435 [Candidatus Omnitrophica bacterium]|nr:hypothetical protein [Candidatus Omnitrophota bacterium]